jgi:hypothetical protein
MVEILKTLSSISLWLIHSLCEDILNRFKLKGNSSRLNRSLQQESRGAKVS